MPATRRVKSKIPLFTWDHSNMCWMLDKTGMDPDGRRVFVGTVINLNLFDKTFGYWATTFQMKSKLLGPYKTRSSAKKALESYWVENCQQDIFNKSVTKGGA